ncbi:precorrin-2 C(20)-methyltransferase [Vallitalea longa]|uniref:Precorrin-2 C(20)-methyltransferase n=1 Tax=Vallitalea longa TaxID=2936439 RepID=A0A9W5YBV4_9FIRM|nr:precorrin-2 C(20)-methyltransferase [Vallitalea longa]GKX29636.1 precorrin-2 C(20)-methyltransferase [Vallitalea longa]
MQLTVIGVGPGDSELITVKAVRMIKEADIILVPVKKEGSTKSTALDIAKKYIEDMDKVLYLYFPMINLEQNKDYVESIFKKHGENINQQLQEGKKIVYLTLGDPMIYCTFTYISEYFEKVNYIPGIPSFLNGAAISRKPLCIERESMAVVNMTDDEDKIKMVFDIHDSIVVMKVCANQKLLKELINEGKRSVTFLTNIGLDNEYITEDINYLNEKVPYFTIGIVR